MKIIGWILVVISAMVSLVCIGIFSYALITSNEDFKDFYMSVGNDWRLILIGSFM